MACEIRDLYAGTCNEAPKDFVDSEGSMMNREIWILAFWVFVALC